MERSKRYDKKRRAILNAAAEVFLREGYVGASMEEIAALCEVSKPTVYKHFTNKEGLFVEVVTDMSSRTSDSVHRGPADPSEDIAAYLKDYALRQLKAVLTPQIMQLRRLVIAEVGRFPDLAQALWNHGPMRALAALAAEFERLAEFGLLRVTDSSIAASQFNWLVMGQPLNQAMLLGDQGIPSPEELCRHADAAVEVFLAAYTIPDDA